LGYRRALERVFDRARLRDLAAGRDERFLRGVARLLRARFGLVWLAILPATFPSVAPTVRATSIRIPSSFCVLSAISSSPDF
jgi:hypothetical protein